MFDFSSFVHRFRNGMLIGISCIYLHWKAFGSQQTLKDVASIVAKKGHKAGHKAIRRYLGCKSI